MAWGLSAEARRRDSFALHLVHYNNQSSMEIVQLLASSVGAGADGTDTDTSSGEGDSSSDSNNDIRNDDTNANSSGNGNSGGATDIAEDGAAVLYLQELQGSLTVELGEHETGIYALRMSSLSVYSDALAYSSYFTLVNTEEERAKHFGHDHHLNPDFDLGSSGGSGGDDSGDGDGDGGGGGSDAGEYRGWEGVYDVAGRGPRSVEFAWDISSLGFNVHVDLLKSSRVGVTEIPAFITRNAALYAYDAGGATSTDGDNGDGSADSDVDADGTLGPNSGNSNNNVIRIAKGVFNAGFGHVVLESTDPTVIPYRTDYVLLVTSVANPHRYRVHVYACFLVCMKRMNEWVAGRENE